MLLFLLYLLFLQCNPFISSFLSQTPCNASCFVAQVCTSRVLTCRDNSDNVTVIESVKCSKRKNFVLIDSERPSLVDYVEPRMFDILLKEGMQSVLIGFGIRNITRYMLSKIPDKLGLTITINGYFIEEIESFAFESKRVTPLFYLNQDLKKFSNRDYTKAQVSKSTNCDSSHGPCLCKEYVYLQGLFLSNYSYYLNETASFVCKNYYKERCFETSCNITSRVSYSTALDKSRKKQVTEDDYCLVKKGYSSRQSDLLVIWGGLLLTLWR